MVKPEKIIKPFLFILILNIVACSSNKNNADASKKDDFDWLCGNWINDKDSTAVFLERWTKSSPGNYNGESCVIDGNDTVFFESIQLQNTDTGIFYSVTILNQNEGIAVPFKLISSSGQTFVFENKKHDFPQRIKYEFKAPDTLNASIEGLVNGVVKQEHFLMWRTPQ